jgi:hypothetical protein
MGLRAAISGCQCAKRREWTVEECRAISVRDVRGDVDPCQQRTLVRWHPPGHPSLTLVARQSGSVRRWWFRCRTCRACCETVLIPPNAAEGD